MSLVRVSLLYMSVYGGILVLTVLSLRMMLKNRLSKRTFSILWCVALLRLLTPFSVSSSFGIFSIMQNQGMADVEDYRTVFLADLFSEGLYLGEASGYYEAAGGNSDDGSIADMEGSPAEDRSAENWFPRGVSLFGKIGITGTVVSMAVFLALYLNCLRRFKTALPMEDPSVGQWLERNRLVRKVRVCQSDRISSPLTYGLVRPVILLPKHLEQDGQKLDYILQHEMVHIRRLDGAWKFAMTAALCLHWFNPLVWVMYVFMNRDLELSCDEEVLHIFGAEARKSYALTLIGMEESRHLSALLYSGFGKNAVEERIGEIMKYKRKTKAAMGAAAVLILTVVCMFATTSKAEEDSGEADKNQPGAGIAADLPVDPPTGYFLEKDGMVGNAGSGTVAGTDSFDESGTELTEKKSRYLQGKKEEKEIRKWLVQKLIEASGEKDHDSILPYIAEGCEVDVDCLDVVTEWEQEEVHVSLYPKTADRCAVSILVKTEESGEDTNDYLTVLLLKEGEDWKICFMGIEK